MKRITFSAAVMIAAVVALRATGQRAPGMDDLLRTAVEQKRVPMAVAMVADARGIAYEHAEGAAKDAIFSIASMTKPVTSVAAMQLYERGLFALDDPAEKYLPELAHLMVFESFDAATAGRR